MAHGMATSLNPPTYPENGTYADLLVWHLYVWRTHPDGSTTKRGEQPWDIEAFKDKLFLGATDDDGEIQRRNKNFNNWTGEGQNVAPFGFYHGRIVDVIFGNAPKFEIWIKDLKASFRRSSPKGNNILSLKAEVATAVLAGSGFIPEIVGSSPSNSEASATLNINHLGADAKHGVKVIADTLAEHYYGRSADLAVVSAFVDARMAGGEAALLIITAPAGFGKSALAVNWCNSMGSHPSRCVAMHLCSISSGRATTSLDNIFANLHRQIAEVYGAAAPNLKDNDAVTGLLATAPPGDKQLLLWLDGLDEADELVPCFLPQKLGERVCVIVSARAEEKLIPPYVDEWQYGLRAKPHLPLRHVLTKLSKDGVQELLTGLCHPVGLTLSDRLAERIYNASEHGYPLFARLMADDALEAMKKGEELDLGAAPESLANYVARQLKRLETLAAWREYQPLFAFLTIAREAVRIDELPALIGQRLLPKVIPYQIARWFNLVADNRHDHPPMLSIVHPKLAELFGQALRYEKAEAALSLCKRMVKTDPDELPLYAWRHMPQHLLEMELIDDAVRLLTNIEFITARFEALGSDDCLSAMRADWMAWYAIERQGTQNGR